MSQTHMRIGDFWFNTKYVRTVQKCDQHWIFCDYERNPIVEIPTNVDKDQDKDALTLFMEHQEKFVTSHKAYIRIGDFWFNTKNVCLVQKDSQHWHFYDCHHKYMISIPISVDKDQDKDALTLFMEHLEKHDTSTNLSNSYKAFLRIGDFWFNAMKVYNVTKVGGENDTPTWWVFKDRSNKNVIEIPTSVDKDQDKDALALLIQHHEKFHKHENEMKNEEADKNQGGRAGATSLE